MSCHQIATRQRRCAFGAGGTLLIAWVVLATPFYAASIRSFDTSQSEAFRSAHESILAEIEEEAATRPPDEDVVLLNKGFPNMWPSALKRRFPGIAAIFVISNPD